MTLAELADTGIGYDWDKQRLVLPVYAREERGSPVRWNGRGLPQDPPKYLSGQLADYVMHDPCWAQPALDRGYGLVLTEDILSAWVVTLCGGGRWYGWPALSTNPQPYQLRALAQYTDHVVVWLDNDNALVRKHARRLTREFEGLGAAVTRVTVEAEPKKMSREDVTRTLEER